MTAHAVVLREVSGAPKDEVEEKSQLDASACEDLREVGGECIVEDDFGEKAANVDDPDCSSVFDPTPEKDHPNAEGIDGLNVTKPDAVFPAEETEVQCGELIIENGERVHCGREGHLAEGSVIDISNGDPVEGEELSVESGKINCHSGGEDECCTVKDSLVFPADGDLVRDSESVVKNGKGSRPSDEEMEVLCCNLIIENGERDHCGKDGHIASDPVEGEGMSIENGKTTSVEDSVVFPADGDLVQDGASVVENGENSRPANEETEVLCCDLIVDNGERVHCGKDGHIAEGSAIYVSNGDPVEGEGLSVENGKSSFPSVVEDECCIVEDSVVFPADRDLVWDGDSVAGNGQNRQPSGEDVNTVEGTVNLSLDDDVASEGSKSLDLDGDGRSAEVQNETVYVEAEPLLLGNEVKALKEVQLEPSSVNGLLEVADGKLRFEHQNNLESTADLEESQHYSQNASADPSDSTLHQPSDWQEKVEEERKSDFVMDTGKNNAFQSVVSKDALLCMDKEGAQTVASDNIQVSLGHETSVLANGYAHVDLLQEAPAVVDKDFHLENGDSLPTYLPAGPVSETAISLGQETSVLANDNAYVDLVQDAPMVVDKDVHVENGDSSPHYQAKDLVSGTVISNGSNDCHRNTSELDASSENASVKSETEVENLAVKCGKDFHVDCNYNTVVEAENDASLIAEDHPVGAADSMGTEVFVNASVGDQSFSRFSSDAVIPRIVFGSLVCEGNMPALPNLEFKFSNGTNGCASKQPVRPGANVKSEFEAESTMSNVDVIDDDDASFSESKVEICSVLNSESASNSVPDVLEVEDEEDKFTTVDCDDKPICQEAKGIEEIPRDETSTSSPKSSCTDALDGQNSFAELVKTPFYFLTKIPRFDDEKVREKIKLAQLEVDEKTETRDVVRAEIQVIRAASKEYSDNFEAAISEERAARELLKAKRQEIDSVQSVINKVRTAISVGDIGGKIRDMEHMIEHESLPLAEEKQYIREIKQLKYLREQLSSNSGKQDELKQALDQKDQIEERLKFLKKELDPLKDKVSRTEAITKAAKKSYVGKKERLNNLQSQFKAADDIRQAAYANLLSLRKQASEKNKHFWMFKEDEEAAKKYASAKNRDELQRLCVNQVDRTMELWNRNDEFRKEYIRCNSRSTLRRLKTLDGRSLGPDEEPPVLAKAFSERVDTVPSVPANASFGPSISTMDQGKQVANVEAEKADKGSAAEALEPINQAAKTKKHAKHALLVNGSETVSVRSEPKKSEEEIKKSNEEMEMARMAEELREKEAAVKLKEQIRLEEKAKAKEALERKKRFAEKARGKAELRAQKEAELKEKEREKRARKKERKKVATAEAITGSSGGVDFPLETMKGTEGKEKSTMVTKRPQKPLQFAKLSKAKSIPLPLRNRSRRRMQTWMWILLMGLLVVVLFFLGDSSYSINFFLQSFYFWMHKAVIWAVNKGSDLVDSYHMLYHEI